MANSPPPPKVLNAVATEERRSAFRQTLQRAGFEVHDAASGSQALELAAVAMPDVVLLDLHLPDMTGFEVCCRLKAHVATASIPVLHLADPCFEDVEFAGHFEEGDEAFLTHPVVDVELLACVRTLLRERHTQRQFNSFLELAADAVVICDRDGKIVRANGQAEEMFGYSHQELAGSQIEMLMPSRFRETHDHHRAGFTACPVTRPMGAVSDLWGLRKDGSEFSVEINLSALPGARETLLASIIRDVTQRKRLEQELRDADKMKNDFLAMLAHELRSPLSAVRMAEQLIRLEVTQTPELDAIMDIINRQLDSMTRIIEDLSDVSSITKGKLQFRSERVELSGVMRAAAEASHSRIEAREHRLSMTLPAESLYLNGDPIRLTQVFTNLLNNAAKYTESGGQIWFSAQRQENEVVVSVRDTGVGIPPEMLLKVFDCFTQVEQTLSMAGGGLGIGLSLVQGSVQTHGGRVEARSEGLGRGSEFIVHLPLSSDAPFLAHCAVAEK